jgi:hypothetical protein
MPAIEIKAASNSQNSNTDNFILHIKYGVLACHATPCHAMLCTVCPKATQNNTWRM